MKGARDAAVSRLKSIDFASLSDGGIQAAEDLKLLSEIGRSMLALEGLFYNYLTSQLSSWSVERELNIFQFFSLLEKQAGNDPSIEYVFSYARALSSAVQALEGWREGERSSLIRTAELAKGRDIISKIKDKGSAANVVRGHIASLFDRELAWGYYSRSRSQVEMINGFRIDQGLNTYFLSPGPQSLLAADCSHRLIKKPSVAEMSLVFSMDAGFCSAYLPLVVHYARNLPEYNCHLVFAGDDCGLKACEEMLWLLVDAQEKCAGRRMENISYSTMKVPDLVRDKATFYACARYLAALDLIGFFSGIYIMDVDVQFTKAPAKFFSELMGRPLCLPETRSLAQIIPWRRYMAGNVFVSNSSEGREFIGVVCNYISAGLVCDNSWTLDQNALCYALERTKINHFDLNNLDRPGVQQRINKLFESNMPGWWVGGVSRVGQLSHRLRRLRWRIR